MKTSVNLIAAITFFFLVSPQAFACSVCFGNPDSLQSKAVTGAVLFLLIVTLVMLSGIAFLLARWTLRARRLAKTAAEAV